MGVRLTVDLDNADRPLILAAGSMLDHDVGTFLRAAATAGFDGVGLRVSGEHAIANDRQADDVRRMADDLDLVIHDAEVIRIDDRWPAGRRPPDSALRFLDTAARVGADAILVVSDRPDVAATVDAIAGLVAVASPLGLMVGLEYMAWTTPATAAAAQMMAEATGCRVIVDLLHHVRVGAGVEELKRLVDAGHLGWVQVCDAATAHALDLNDVDLDDTIHEARHRRLPPGQGALPLTKLLTAVPAGTVVSVEVQSDQLADLDAEERATLLATTTRSLG